MQRDQSEATKFPAPSIFILSNSVQSNTGIEGFLEFSSHILPPSGRVDVTVTRRDGVLPTYIEFIIPGRAACSEPESCRQVLREDVTSIPQSELSTETEGATIVALGPTSQRMILHLDRQTPYVVDDGAITTFRRPAFRLVGDLPVGFTADQVNLVGQGMTLSRIAGAEKCYSVDVMITTPNTFGWSKCTSIDVQMRDLEKADHEASKLWSGAIALGVLASLTVTLLSELVDILPSLLKCGTSARHICCGSIRRPYICQMCGIKIDKSESSETAVEGSRSPGPPSAAGAVPDCPV